ncbi:hypothetical protein GIS00_00280 [Nakamurella sp. YIM 132087]|uniref:DUF3159 domain-containing protein n=1 Tax=Nakamurella alba TaxID=2665158 RepID=A0A7K1FE57_9ACTN|nr:hypothetical protein [Nakamurella alba]MTD12378.1 hypothetical protein [Nakamurella alba]
MNPKSLLLGLLPWIVFSLIVHRAGATVAGLAAVAAVVTALALMVKDGLRGIKIIDVTGVLVFGGFAVVAFAGGTDAATWVADYGRGSAAALLGVVMLASAAVLPFSEQYARESVPQEYWHSPVFRAVNRKISAVWGVVMLAMAGSHLLAGYLDPAGSVAGGTINATGPAGLLLNWVVPAALVFAGYKATQALTAGASNPAAAAAQRG